MIQLSPEVWTFTGRYVPLPLHTEGSTLLQWIYSVGHAVLFAVTERQIVLTEFNKLETLKFTLFE